MAWLPVVGLRHSEQGSSVIHVTHLLLVAAEDDEELEEGPRHGVAAGGRPAYADALSYDEEYELDGQGADDQDGPLPGAIEVMLARPAQSCKASCQVSCDPAEDVPSCMHHTLQA